MSSAFPPSTIRCATATPDANREALKEGVRYHFFIPDMPYQVFVATYLLGEALGATPQVIYDQYTILG